MQPVTQADVEAAIASEHYFTAAQAVAGSNLCAEDPDSVKYLTADNPLHLLTFCVLVTRNGHTVTGESYCQDPAKFDPETGRQWARKAAVDKLWPMVVYAAREPGAKAAAIARKFIDDNRVSCPEACCEDRVYENAPELVEKLADVVGYYRYPDEDPEAAADVQDAS